MANERATSGTPGENQNPRETSIGVDIPSTERKRDPFGIALTRTALGVADIGWRLGIPVFAGLIGWKSREFLLPNPPTVNVTSQTIAFPKEESRPDSNVLATNIWSYLRLKATDGLVLQKLLVDNSSATTTSLANKVSRDYLIRGVALLQLTPQDIIQAHFTDPDAKQISINNTKFDLTNQYQFHLASEIIDKSLELSLPPNLKATPDKEIIDQINLLYWFKAQDFDIRFEPDSFAFFLGDKMLTLARTAYLNRHDSPKLLVVQFYRNGDSRYPNKDESAGSYDCRYSKRLPLIETAVRMFKFSFTGKLKCPILISNVLDSEGIAHEYGHHVGANADHFSNKDFEKKIKAAQNKYKDEITHSADLSLSPYAAEDPAENYAETFAWYIAKGSEFRRLLSQMRWWDWGAYQVQLQAYNFFKEKYEGLELTSNGTRLLSNPLLERQGEIEKGKVFVVEDKSPSPFREQGIHLRLDINNINSINETAVVFHGDKVKILFGPAHYVDTQGEQYLFWEVEPLSRLGSISGWIAEEWLGEEVYR